VQKREVSTRLQKGYTCFSEQLGIVPKGKINYARQAILRASNNFREECGFRVLNNGILESVGNTWRQKSDSRPEWVELYFPFDQPIVVDTVVMFQNARTVGAPGRNLPPLSYEFQYRKNGKWVTLVSVDKSFARTLKHKFSPVRTDALRFLQTRPLYGGYSWSEIEVLGPGPEGGAKNLNCTDDIVLLSSRPDNIFEESDTPSFVIRVKNPLSEQARIRVECSVTDFYFEPIKKTSYDLDCGPRESKSISLAIPDFRKTGPFYLAATVYFEDRIIGQKKLLFGVKKGIWDKAKVESFTHSSTKVKTSKEALAEAILTAPVAWRCDENLLPALDDFRSIKQGGANAVELQVYWGELEPLPGVYNFRKIDEAIRHADKTDLNLVVMLRVWDTPKWLREENMRDQKGREPISRLSGYTDGAKEVIGVFPSYWSSRFRNAYLKVIKLLLRRYRNEGRIVAWQPGPLSLEFGWPREDRGQYFDYSTHAQKAYLRYLKEVKGFSLRQLNHRYGKKYASWDEVKPPAPENFLAKAWLDFEDFNQWTLCDWLEELFAMMRSEDKRLIMQQLTENFMVVDESLRVFRKYGIMAATAASQYPHRLITYSLFRRWDVPIRVASNILPPRPFNFAQSLFVPAAFGANIYHWQGTGFGQSRAAWHLFDKLTPIFTELSKTNEKPDLDIGAMYCFGSRKSGCATRMNPTMISPQLLEEQLASGRWLDWFSNYSDLTDLSRYKLIIDSNSMVLREKVIDALVRYVRNGGHLVLFPDSGRYMRENTSMVHPLFARLGYKLERPLKLSASSTMATVNNPAALFRKLKRIRLSHHTKLPTVTGMEILAVDRQKQPMIVKWRCGKGQVLLIGGRPTASLNLKGAYRYSGREDIATGKLLDDLALWVSAPRYARTSYPLLSAVRDNGHNRYVLLYNMKDEPIETSVAVPNLKTGEYRLFRLCGKGTVDMGVRSSRSLANGVKMRFDAYDFSALKCVPIPQACEGQSQRGAPKPAASSRRKHVNGSPVAGRHKYRQAAREEVVKMTED